MIFVTVGTHEQQFNRLIAAVDRLKKMGLITTEVIMQIGYSNYVPTECSYQSMMGSGEMEEHVRTADIVITHGGPGSIFGALKHKKIPIVVPRRSDFQEHVDMHQVEFAKHLQRKNNIIPIFEIQHLQDSIVHYEHHVEQLGGYGRSTDNLNAFTQQLNKVVNTLMKR